MQSTITSEDTEALVQLMLHYAAVKW